MSEVKAYKITDCARSKRHGVVVTFFEELILQARELFDICATSNVKIVLESDGTEVQEQYFHELEKQTCFIILNENEKWISPPDCNHLSTDSLMKCGNEEYNSKEYSKALEFYNKAIANVAEYATCFSNRAACYMMLNQHNKALEDCRISVTLNNKFVKGHIRLIRCCIDIGEIAEAEKNLEIVSKLDPTNPSISSVKSKLDKLKTTFSEAELSYEKKAYGQTIALLNKVITVAKHCASFRIMKAECLVFQKRFQEAQDVVLEILNTIDMENVDAMYIQGLCMYYMDKMERAFTNFEYVLKLMPNHLKAIDVYLKAKSLAETKEKGNEAFKAGKFKEACDHYTTALSIDPTNDSINSKLYYNRATVWFKLGSVQKSVEDCSSALNLDEKYIKALLRRAKCYFDLKQYDDAVLDYEKAYYIEGTESIRILLNEAKSYQNTSNQKCYYDILGIQKDASLDEIKKAYRKCALMHHPDRHVNATEAQRKDEEKKFKDLSEAYTVLSDPIKKRLYDQCQDSENSKNSTDANDTRQRPAVLYFKGFPKVHPNTVIQLITQKMKFVTSIHLVEGKNYGLARFSTQASAKLALRNPLKIRCNKKEYSIVFTQSNHQ